uniref:Uncharacterized protein n=1 Tax=Arundo donax TaxID=35708 RepID=A0A0A9ESI3_ARUDO
MNITESCITIDCLSLHCAMQRGCVEPRTS